jgi:hypothetical protein
VPVLGTAALGVLEKLMNDFGDDIAGGVGFLAKQLGTIPEPDRSELLKTLWEEKSKFPREAQQELAMLWFKCDAGQQQALENMEQNKSECPPELRREILGD